ncbi:nitroreductase/quinone reductase family protein [Streptomyces sp. NPDC051561]|uniref:nitroreductase/quinone reductase family protein n=1 Tax=Streptomyces sp. NPDC051561 TaxID=3365658 RepID=UPI0037B99CDB
MSSTAQQPIAPASTTTPAAPLGFNQSVIDEFRANKGKVGGPFEGGDLLLLTTTGARSGRRSTVPLGYARDEDGQLLVTASNSGSGRHPDWYRNLLARPAVEVEIGTEHLSLIAVPAEGEHRDRLFARMVAAAPGYADYQRQTTRVLPVVVLQHVEYGPYAPDGGPRPVLSVGDKLMEIHTWLRGQLQRVRADAEAHFAAATAGTDPGAPTLPGLGLQIRQHCLAFCDTLDFHHKAEDSAVLPQIVRHHPHLADPIAQLGEEHRKMATLKASLIGHLSEYRSADPQTFLAELIRMSEELTAHLDYEESVIFPVLNDIPLPSGPPPAGE